MLVVIPKVSSNFTTKLRSIGYVGKAGIVVELLVLRSTIDWEDYNCCWVFTPMFVVSRGAKEGGMDKKKKKRAKKEQREF